MHRMPTRRREAGSAYLTVLLVLLLLTILGLSLVLITQIESEIGTNERTLHRTFYAADSGLPAAIARKMDGGLGPFRFQMNSDTTGIVPRADAVDVGNFLPVRIGFCNLCTANVGKESYRIDYLAVTQAVRFASTSPTGGDRHPLARQAVSSEVLIQPDPGLGDFQGLGKKSGKRLGDLMSRGQDGSTP